MNNHQADALRVMGEVIDAQAKHIERLEAGHWSKHTGKRVVEARQALAELTPESPEAAAIREAAYAARTSELPVVEVPAWPDADLAEELDAMGRCYVRHEASPGTHMDTPHPKAMCPSPLFDKGGYLPRGLSMIEDANAARQALPHDTAQAGLNPRLNTFKDISEWAGKCAECGFDIRAGHQCQLPEPGANQLEIDSDMDVALTEAEHATGKPIILPVKLGFTTYDPDTDDQP